MQQDQSNFPELNLTKFKEISQQWVDDYKAEDVSITEIKLCKHRVPKYIKRANKGKRNIKYAVVFSIPEYHGQYSLSANDTAEEHFKKLTTNNPYENFISDTGYYETVFTERTHSPLFDENFQQIYKQRPHPKFKKEWLFIPKYQGFILSESIRIDEGFVVLYDQSIKDGNEKFKVNNLGTHNQKKQIDKALEEICPELERFCIELENEADSIKNYGGNRKAINECGGNELHKIALQYFAREEKKYKIITEELIDNREIYKVADRRERMIRGTILQDYIYNSWGKKLTKEKLRKKHTQFKKECKLKYNK